MDVLAVSEVNPVLEPALPDLLSQPGQETAIAKTPPAASPFSTRTTAAIRTSLKASTLDGVFATVFSNVTNGVLLTNFLLNLGASPSEVGMAAAIPMLANLLQPVGAQLAERTTSRHYFCLWIYAPARLLWLLLIPGIALVQWQHLGSQMLIGLTLAIALLSSGFGALGSAPWFSWMAMLVPRRLRGRYFGFRNSAANLTNLISVPLLGLLVSHWGGGSLEGFAVALGIGIVLGLLSLWFQNFMVDVNPQVQQQLAEAEGMGTGQQQESQPPLPSPAPSFFLAQDANFLRFLLFFGGWMFSLSLSAPFFNLYLLDNLHLDVSQATIYNSLTAGANLLMLLFWGKLADRIGNRPVLLSVGFVVALTPLLWLWVGTDALSIWLWLPLLHLLIGGAGAAIDLCSSNLQLGVVPLQNQATCFGVVAAIAGICGALGTMAGGFLAQCNPTGGLLGLFAISSGVRLLALLPLFRVNEERSHSLRQMMRSLLPVNQE